MLRFAIVGYDHAHLPKYVPAIATHPRAALAAVIAPGANRALAKTDAARFGATYLESLEDLGSSLEVDAAYVGTPPNQHRRVVERLAERGVHILCDKPLATNLEDADAILAATRRHGVRLMVPFNPRYQVPVQKLKETLDERALGDLHAIHATKYGKVPRGIPGLDTSWFFDASQAGFGGFGDIGIHAVDALRWLTGREVRSVYARIDRCLDASLPVDDLGTAILEFEGGLHATLQAGWANPVGNPSWLSVGFEVLGSAGAAFVEKPYHDLEVADGTRSERVPWWRTDVTLLVDEFVRAVEEEREPSITGEDARRALEIVIAAYRSSETGDAVEISP